LTPLVLFTLKGLGLKPNLDPVHQGPLDSSILFTINI
jgi:hypothetical protein